jgi:hypothetical protein
VRYRRDEIRFARDAAPSVVSTRGRSSADRRHREAALGTLVRLLDDGIDEAVFDAEVPPSGSLDRGTCVLNEELRPLSCARAVFE